MTGAEPEGERIARLEQWTETHGRACSERYDTIMGTLNTIRDDMREDRTEMRAATVRNHKRMDAHARGALAMVVTVALAIITLLARTLLAR